MTFIGTIKNTKTGWNRIELSLLNMALMTFKGVFTHLIGYVLR